MGYMYSATHIAIAILIAQQGEERKMALFTGLEIGSTFNFPTWCTPMCLFIYQQAKQDFLQSNIPKRGKLLAASAIVVYCNFHHILLVNICHPRFKIQSLDERR